MTAIVRTELLARDSELEDYVRDATAAPSQVTVDHVRALLRDEGCSSCGQRLGVTARRRVTIQLRLIMIQGPSEPEQLELGPSLRSKKQRLASAAGGLVRDAQAP
jgi:hypothetical protein